MKSNDQILETLNEQLAEELTAVNQYIVHSEMCANWNLDRLHNVIEKRAIEEMRHAEMLIARILFLEGKPVVSKLNPMHVGAEVLDQLQNDHVAELGAVKSYNTAVQQAASLGDNGSRALFESILKDEEAHIDWIEAQLDQINQMGIQNYLAQQMG
ncbi:bacterioferritin [Longilinea arvoryzae]|uniref:Bacterioferritin n=1 Tax=Longilinea arvoryzae TaxID=360412 RepID=A0A0S7BNL1_9CHLR|nr:bacterioferritin [Longilinea arvoryzae]GAP15611.1 bacterioferritin [Longilinea arvoryzae]